jgi:hypothetical protein
VLLPNFKIRQEPTKQHTMHSLPPPPPTTTTTKIGSSSSAQPPPPPSQEEIDEMDVNIVVDDIKLMRLDEEVDDDDDDSSSSQHDQDDQGGSKNSNASYFGLGGESPRSPLLELKAAVKMQKFKPLDDPNDLDPSQHSYHDEHTENEDGRLSTIPQTISTESSSSSQMTSEPRQRKSLHHEDHWSGKKVRGGSPSAGHHRIRQRRTSSSIRKRKIRFAPHIKCKEIKHVNDYSDEDFQKIWMTQVEYQIIRAMCKATAIMMMKGEVILKDDSDYCARGLEHKTKAGSRTRSQRKMRNRFAVLNAQEETSDPQFIAEASEEQSQACRQTARDRALADEKESQEYLADLRLEFQMGLGAFQDIIL